MVGKLFIDGLDAFSEYGIFVEQYGYKALVQMPSFKKLNSTEWPEYDGEETDLSNPILDSKTFSIPFCITDILSASDLFEVLSDGAYHIFDFAELGKSYKLRLLTNPALSAKIQLGKITLNFADDFPPVYPTDETDIESLNEYNTLLNQAPYATARRASSKTATRWMMSIFPASGSMSSTARIGIFRKPRMSARI